MTRLILVALLALPGLPGGAPWDKVPAKWSPADVYQILQDSPWSPVRTTLQPEPGPQPGSATGAPVNTNDENPVPSFQIGRSRVQPAIPVLWWSSKTVRLAELRLRQLLKPSQTTEPLRADDLPDYILVIAGREPFRILRDAKEDLHDTVFLELPSSATLDLESARFLEETQQGEARVEFHFPRQIEGRATLDPEIERVVFHCRASAKTPLPWHDNALSLRAEFRPRAMLVRGVPDL